MKIMSDVFYGRMFTCAALWNLGIGLSGIIATDFSVALFFGPGALTGEFVALVSFRLFMVAIMMFGAGYYIVSRELMLNRGIVWLGLASKLILFVIFVFLFFTGRATILALLALTGDFLWSLLFILFLYHTRDRVKINILVG